MSAICFAAQINVFEWMYLFLLHHSIVLYRISGFPVLVIFSGEALRIGENFRAYCESESCERDFLESLLESFLSLGSLSLSSFSRPHSFVEPDCCLFGLQTRSEGPGK